MIRPRIARPWAACLAFAAATACSTPEPRRTATLDDWRQRPSAGAAEDTASTPAPADLAALLRHADRHSPTLRAAHQHWKAALERVDQAGALPDPRLTFGYFLDEVQTRTGPMEWRVGLQQPLPWFGELDSAGRAAVAEAEAAAAHYHAARAELFAEIRATWAELAWTDASARVTDGHRELLANWEQVALTRYANGLGTDADMIRAQIELGSLEDRSRSLRDLRNPLTARLNALLGRPHDAPLPTPVLETLTPPGDEAALRQRLERDNPRLIALEARVRAAEARIDLADTDAWPDAAVGLDFTRIGRGGEDALALTGGLSLPIQRGRIGARIREAEAALAAAHADRRALGFGLDAQLAQALYDARDAQRRHELYSATLLPKGHEAVQAISAAYQAGEAGFLELIDAERVLLEFELAAVRAQTDAVRAAATTDALLGVDPVLPSETRP